MVFQLAASARHWRASGRAIHGRMMTNAMLQRQNASATGGTASCIARPTTALPAQNRALRLSSRYGDI